MTQNRRCLSEITNSVIDLFLDEKYFTCKASIIKVMYENGWYYNACPNPNCGKKLNTNAEGYDCTKHGVIVPIQKYILKFDIEDNTTTARATAFEEVASTLMKKSAAELIAMDSKENGTEFAENEFRKLIGHTAIFQIRVTKFNKERNNNSLTIYKVFPLHNDYYNGEENPKTSPTKKDVTIWTHLFLITIPHYQLVTWNNSILKDNLYAHGKLFFLPCSSLPILMDTWTGGDGIEAWGSSELNVVAVEAVVASAGDPSSAPVLNVALAEDLDDVV
ncbi:hypothetical protein IFM89_015636 [Coptis chinensis]|uniref:Replication factor A C-terminal domain-containing protein n=1 Tax=Coptis chinensis TaxID=261450 RepID=A0A835IVK9_9MAGN|nr:hypothetical protein IFM89_015636 [Coptis chinensis]